MEKRTPGKSNLEVSALGLGQHGIMTGMQVRRQIGREMIALDSRSGRARRHLRHRPVYGQFKNEGTGWRSARPGCATRW